MTAVAVQQPASLTAPLADAAAVTPATPETSLATTETLATPSSIAPTGAAPPNVVAPNVAIPMPSASSSSEKPGWNPAPTNAGTAPPVVASEAEMERHVAQTNDRLHCIRQHLQTPHGFSAAAREMLEWCSDARAFNGPFEEQLIACLTTVSEVAPLAGYDLELGYRLLAVCAQHRESMSPKSAALLAAWCEELGRQVLLSKHNPDAAASQQQQQQQQQQHSMYKPDGFNNGPTMSTQQHIQGATPGQQLSVVTTIWAGTPTTQTIPQGYYAQGQYVGQKAGSLYGQGAGPPPGGQAPPPHQQYRAHSTYSGRPMYDPSTSGAPSGPVDPNAYAPQGGQPPNTPMGVAMVAAAASATATATATAAMAAMEQQQVMMGPGPPEHPDMYQTRDNHPSQMPYGVYPGPGGGMHPSQRMKMGPVYMRRPAPYPPNPHMYMQRRMPNYGGMPAAMYGGGGGGPPPMYKAYPPGAPAMSPQSLPMRPNFPSAAYGRANSYGGESYMNGTANGGMGELLTPPMTPAQQHVTPVKFGGDVKPPPMLPVNKDDELRLTFPVEHGCVLPPFRLEHNLAVSTHLFPLEPHVFQSMAMRSDLELQLKCYHHEDRLMLTNWPQSVAVSVNGHPLPIERGENLRSHRPLYLKHVCQPGNNSLQITVSQCCCSHLFILQLVHRPRIRSAREGLLRKRLLPAEHCVAKIKRSFGAANAAAAAAAAAASTTSSGTPSGAPDPDPPTPAGLETTQFNVSLKCPISFQRIRLPSRGSECRHTQCFDLESYLEMNCERDWWKCPICGKASPLDGLEIDQYMWGILTNLQDRDVDEVTIDSAACWRPKLAPGARLAIKEEVLDPGGGGGGGGDGRWAKGVSPGSMPLPTTYNPSPSGANPPAYPQDSNAPADQSQSSQPQNSSTNSQAAPELSFGPISSTGGGGLPLTPQSLASNGSNGGSGANGKGSVRTPGSASMPTFDESVTTSIGSDLSSLDADMSLEAAVAVANDMLESQSQETLDLLADGIGDSLTWLDEIDLASGAAKSEDTNAADDLLALFDSQ